LSAFAQDTKQDIRLNFTNAPLSQVIASVEKQSTYTFFYDNDVQMTVQISVQINSKDIQAVLDAIFRDTPFGYRFVGQRISLFRKDQTETPKSGSYTVTGVVNDAMGPIAGATVTTKDGKGTITSLDGDFTLADMKDGDVLTISFVGYKRQEVTLRGGQRRIVVTLHEEATELTQVVVTAMGIKREAKALSYNVQQVNGDELTAVKSTNLMNSLAGKVAGVNITSSSSGLGGATRVVMRGTKSIDQNNNALYVIDGVPMYNYGGGGGKEFGSTGATEPIADLNPDDIESMSVLTGAAAAALYGNQGANGAIIITTKQGKKDKLEVNFSSSIEALSAFVTPQFQNRYGTGEKGMNMDVNVKSYGAYLQPDQRYDYDPTDDFLRTGTTFTNNISLATGNDRSQTYFSASVVNGNGIVPNNEYDRYNFTLRNTSKFLKDKMTLDLGASYIIQDDQNMRNQGVYSNPIVSAYLFPRGTDFGKAKMFERYDPARGINTQFWDELVGTGDFYQQNPYWVAYRNLLNNKKKRYMFNASLSYDILSWLNVTGRVRLDSSHNSNSERYYASTISTLANANGKMVYGESNYQQIYADLLVSVNKQFRDFGLHVNLGTSINDTQDSGQSVWGQIRLNGIPNVFNMKQVDPDQRGESVNLKNEDQSQAIYASAELNYKSLVFLTATARNDWEAAMAGTDSPCFFYPSIGASAILSDIFKLPEPISFLKVRGSWAKVGNKIPKYIVKPQYDFANGAWENKSVFPIYSFKPEATYSYEFGLTARLFHHLNIDLTWYHATSKNQTYNPGITPTSGYKSMYVQTGSVRNTGIELAVGYSNTWHKFSWSTNLTYSKNSNKILELIKQGYSLGGFLVPNLPDLERGGLDRAKFILKEGGTIGDLYSYKDFLRDDRGNIYIDDAGNPLTVNLDENNRIKLGSVLPKGNLSWRNDFAWNRFNLGFLITARLGGIVYSQTQSALDYYGVSEASALARDNGGVWMNGGRVDAEKYYKATAAVGNALPQNYVYDATNVRLQELTIGYTIPKKWLANVADINISAYGRNLWMIYCKAPFDPETTANTTDSYYQGIDYFMMPSLRNIGVSLKLKF
jgi:TonB-linked SusC/RagA family outer membrane protein